MDYRQMLREIHGDTITWFESEEEMKKEQNMGGDTILEFINREVWQDSDTGKWFFMGKEFKREGQARKAAKVFFLKKIS